MSEAEFELLLDMVRTEMEPDPQDLASLQTFFSEVPLAANDNGTAWPLVPFPDGWEASC
ncbi:hypothetical protein [Rhodopseudomonas sp. P2A-2r]|uniref:hypothetical protein n=1 Tax=unclassified Rhodopseudomonas TaxID=2638247 RepID=UPI0022345168|nr:hypothetical protein [Rhodopseudomonas sp. P2A-2r]UZE46834.1 hypothetical protein ONR75_17470 [Rhodopseudomonas sp. P2A-2r]